MLEMFDRIILPVPLNRERIKQMTNQNDEATVDLMVRLAEGNPGAVTALGTLMEAGKLDTLKQLDAWGMRADQIWVGWKNWAMFDVVRFAAGVATKDPSMVALINERCAPKTLTGA